LRDLTLETVETECRDYLDRLFEVQRIPPRSGEERDITIDVLRGSHGLGFTGLHEPEIERAFRLLLEAYNRLTNEAGRSGLSEKAEGLLDQLGQSVHSFGDTLETPEFRDYPVLAAIPVDAFLNAILTIPGSNFEEFLRSIHARYDYRREATAAEADWLSKLMKCIEGSAARLRTSTRTEDRLWSERLKWVVNSRMRALIEDHAGNAADNISEAG
jgi:hypothetical protein